MSKDIGGGPSTSSGARAASNEPKGFAVYPLTWCPHLELVQPLGDRQIDVSAPCGDCGDSKENWICLHCYSIFCSRYVNKHMLVHKDAECHMVALSFSDLSVWCYECDYYVDNELLYPVKNSAHRAKFGEDMLKPDYSQDIHVNLES